ncbi:helix-turn-helix transcriptional regulator [Ruminococcus sp.]|uniref:helix-turn-helix transcriptional regulator n=1 Tax=Ruminococcus sp. TaxID=41978 RepID=UPI0025F64FF7|nr:helix-turn-helix transcriptional regulator [Ruminococcus sp.]MBR1432090.1 helix-turn-helix transcriptional regulator [Ruminococcus sp.]
MDFYSQLRKRMIDTMQLSLKQIRQILGLGVQEFSDIVGLTRQSINNLENSKIKMSTVQYIAVCAVIDHFTESQPELVSVIISILNTNDSLFDNALFEDLPNNSLLKKWFVCFSEDSKIFARGSTDLIEELCNNYKIFLDDTALCVISSENQILDLISNMQNKSKRFIIPLRAIESIQNQWLDSEASVKGTPRNGMYNLRRLRELGVVEIRGEKSDTSIIATIASVFIKYKVIYRLALITQNPKLAQVIMSLNTDDIGGFNVLVLYVSDGNIYKWEKLDTVAIKEESETPGELKEMQDQVVETTQEPHNDNSALSGWDVI